MHWFSGRGRRARRSGLVRAMHRALGALGILLAAGCSGAHSGTCMPFFGIAPYTPLVYPVPNATHVPTTAGEVIIGAAPGTQTVVLANANGDIVASGIAGTPPSPLPSPLGIQPGEAIAALHFPALTAATVYTVSTRSTYDGCSYVGYMASFTTL